MINLPFATGNKNKQREILEILPQAVFLPSVELTEIQPKDHTLDSIVHVAKDKAIRAKELLKKSVIIEDTSLRITALDGFPGCLVRFISITNTQRESITWALKGVSDRSAEALCTFAWYDEKEKVAKSVTGSLLGTIAERRFTQSKHSFGWDDIFIPAGETKTMAELGSDWKKKFSHRARALAKLVKV